MATLIIPTPLRKYTNQNRTFETTEDTLHAAIQEFVNEYPQVEGNLLDDNGDVRSYIKLYMDDEEVHPNKEEPISIGEETEISIVPAIAGGCCSR